MQMDFKKFLGICAILILSLLFLNLIACRTTKNTGTAIKEGTEAGAKEVGDKAEDVGDAAKGVGEKVEDASITAAVKMKFANDANVSASKIDVDTKDGVVTLTGTVSSQAEADRAQEIARTVDGVKMVNSNLVVRGS